MKDTDYPDEYVPSVLRPAQPEKREHITFACGYQDKPGSYGMFAGPFRDLKMALESCPDEMKQPYCFIIRFNLDGTDEPIYRWNYNSDKWIRWNQR